MADQVPEVGEVFVQGHEQQTARDLLAAAVEAGYDETIVRTTVHGFIVPEAVWDAYADGGDDPDADTTPTEF